MKVHARALLLVMAVVASLLGFAAAPAGASAQSIFAFGDAPFHGSTGTVRLNHPIVGMATTPAGDGYWLAARDGRVYSFGAADAGGSVVAAPTSAIVGIAGTRTGKGYWLATAAGGIYSVGDAPFFGSLGAVHLNQPVVGIAATPSGKGYWLVAEDGGIFSFGDARFHGSTGAIRLNQPIVGMASTRSGGGYWLVARDGGIFSFGDARFHGSTGNIRLARSVVGMTPTPSGNGYWLVAADGGLFTFGDAKFLGSLGGSGLTEPAVGVVSSPSGNGYWLVSTGHLATSPTANPAEIRLHDGNHAVGGDAGIRAGTYRAQSATASCTWERRGSDGVVLASKTSAGRQLVTVKATDGSLTTNGCAPFTSDLLPVTRALSAPFGDGDWIANVDIAAGRWSAPGGKSCTWARVSDFSGDAAARIDGASAQAHPVVDVAADDAGFVTSGCGSWTRG